ncbi:DinB family protein [Cytobacillus purgationiresistens]|uniref:DinB-like domain-containing protein n=1 Tax=Cytobacillus purgationiresistens TaxID=863449 RepID=A0ABU0AEA3_9BACI|nr:DinB family protein [Cytobacillus purgationiresistens]MDQ0268415.1 hypothetical protein [Cytobacillus purgationiresistens]
MEESIINHLKTVRSITENSLSRIKEDSADIIPHGYNNNIRWNYGHIVYVQELLVFGAYGEDKQIPQLYENLFAAGTKPSDWVDNPPSLNEILKEMEKQSTRVEQAIKTNFTHKLPTPFKNRAGITFYTVGETLLFSAYHEALHMETIKRIHRECKKLMK